MTNTLPIQVLLTTLVGTTGIVFLLGKLYAILCALYLRFSCRKLTSESARNDKGDSVFHDGLTKELGTASKYFAYALLAALVLLVFLWFYNNQSGLKRVCKDMMSSFHLIACAAFAAAELTRCLTAILLPSKLNCRGGLMAALKRSNGLLLPLAALYTVGRWMYSL